MNESGVTDCTNGTMFAYSGEPTAGVCAFNCWSGEGKTLPLTRVYGKISGSSRLISAGADPEHIWMISRWNICTGQPRNVCRREIGYPNVSTAPRDWKKLTTWSSTR